MALHGHHGRKGERKRPTKRAPKKAKGGKK